MTVFGIDNHEAFRLLCQHMGKWGMLFEFDSDDDDVSIQEYFKAAPWLADEQMLDPQTLHDKCGILLADTEEEIMHLYNQTVGWDGPTEANPYNGIAKVYALTCTPLGTLRNENT